MPAPRLVEVYEIVKRRRLRREAERRSPAQRALQAGALLLGAAGVAAALLALLALPFYTYITADLPPVERLNTLLDPQTGELLQPSELFDRSGTHSLLRLEPATAPRAFVDGLANPQLINAFIASQDPAYWSQPSLPLWRLAAGPSGIAERLMARVLLADEPEGWRKNLRTRLLAADALRHYGRAQVLDWALNSSYFGHWAFGVESAAQLYFGKPAAQLSLAESAVLAAVAQAPALNPLDTPELAVEYQHLVLSAMRDQGLISDADFAAAFAEELHFAEDTEADGSAFTRLAVEQLEEALGAERLQIGGLKVTTTLDFELQAAAAELVDPTSEAAVLDPINGQILALVGDQQPEPLEGMETPLMYLLAFAAGHSPASLAWDLPSTRAFQAADYAGPTTLRASLAAGTLQPVEALLAGTSPAGQAEQLAAFGLDFEEDNALQLASVYGVLAAGGLRVGQGDADALRPSAILFAGDSQGGVVLNWTAPQVSAVTSAELAYLVTDVLADASVRPAGALTPPTGRPAASFAQGEWAAGYTPQRVVALWGPQAAADWPALFLAAHEDLPIKNWDVPAGLSSVTVCVPSGQLPSQDCPQKRRELFLRGAEPTQVDSLYQRIAIDRLNGSLATVFTPQQYVQQQVFLVVPEAAQAWAAAAGIAQPPEEYDTVSVVTLQSSPATIASPAAFSQVSGVVPIVPILDEDALTYDVQVGPGLLPSEWLLVAEGQADELDDVEWDTQGLSGVWAIQLQTWDAEGVLTRAYSVVTIEAQ